MWAENSVFYQIYTLGFCGAPYANENDPEQEMALHRIRKVTEWIPHMKKLGIDAVYFCPLFESDTHGYNTRDYKKIDVRLGTNEDFREVCRELHENGIRIVLDGVFNHVGRGFAQFQDVIRNRENSPYKDWFHISFDGNSNYNDGLWYEGWEGNYDLVKLNLRNEEVISHIFDAIRWWVDYFGIDGLRLEILGGDYKVIMGDGKFHSATNYECYKGIHSAFNSMNMFEIVHSLIRQFGSDPWTLYRGYHLLSFVDNHDVSRIATILQRKEHLPLVYAMCFGMPGIPCIYYGSEWGAEGDKKNGDPSLRPCFEQPMWNELTDWISRLAFAKKNSQALYQGDFRSVLLTNKQCIFERKTDTERVLVAINADEEEYVAHFDAGCGMAVDLITGQKHDFGGGSHLPPYSAYFWLMEK